MNCMTDPKIRNIVLASASQSGKSECELNFIGYIIDNDPGTIVYVQPSLEDARKFSKLRVSPMIRDCANLRRKVHDKKAGKYDKNSNTMLQKSFPGGMLIMCGSNSASALSSTPARYIIGDERDRWAQSAGAEGDPWELAKARQRTFYNSKSIEVSTPTILGRSNIESSYQQGTQEKWCYKCPSCGVYSNIVFSDIKFDPESYYVGKKKLWKINGPVEWRCPKCGETHREEVVRRQPTKWVADNPDAYNSGIRSFWLNAFSSPWVPWEKIVLEFLNAKDYPERLQVVFNTLFGELWEDRGDLVEEEEMLSRLEDYGKREDGTPVELPDGVLVLTCGVDTQDNRLEYEVVGHGLFGETWGIKRGVIMGRPDSDETWDRLDGVIDHAYRFKDNQALKVSFTCVDSGGHFTQEVYENCKKRIGKGVFATMGRGGDGVPFTRPPRKMPIREDPQNTAWLYTLGVDAGKAMIMQNLKVEKKGPRYCHFSNDPDAGYDIGFFNGLLSEKMTLVHTSSGDKWAWKKIPGHERNEPLDCRNYALAAFRILNPDLDAVQRRLKGLEEKPAPKPVKRRRKQVNYFNDW